MKSFIIIFITFLVSISCRDLVQDEFPDFNSVPTINSILVADSLLKVHVSFAGKIASNKLLLVENANISLFENGEFKEELLYTEKGIYQSTSLVEPLKCYTCEVDIPGYDLVSCLDSLPAPTLMQNITHIKQAGRDEEGTPYPAIEFTFNNNPQQNQYFEVVIRLIKYEGEGLAELETITDPVLLSEGIPIALFSNKDIDSTTYRMHINYTTNEVHGGEGSQMEVKLYPLILELRSVSKDYYLHRKQMYFYEKGRYSDDFSGVSMAFSLHSNIVNSYGIFAGYSSVQSEVIDPNL